jgi:hypothetical protein
VQDVSDDAVCYGKRYPDLFEAFCATANGCDAEALREHWEKHKDAETRVFGCRLGLPAPDCCARTAAECAACMRRAEAPKGDAGTQGWRRHAEAVKGGGGPPKLAILLYGIFRHADAPVFWRKMLPRGDVFVFTTFAKDVKSGRSFAGEDSEPIAANTTFRGLRAAAHWSVVDQASYDREIDLDGLIEGKKNPWAWTGGKDTSLRNAVRCLYQMRSLPGRLQNLGCDGGQLQTAPISVGFRSFRLTFRRAIIPRSDLEARTSFFGTRARRTETLKRRRITLLPPRSLRELFLAHDAGQYTHVLVSRADVLFTRPVDASRFETGVVIPNYAGWGGFNDRFLAGPKVDVLKLLDRVDVWKRTGKLAELLLKETAVFHGVAVKSARIGLNRRIRAGGALVKNQYGGDCPIDTVANMADLKPYARLEACNRA